MRYRVNGSVAGTKKKKGQKTNKQKKKTRISKAKTIDLHLHEHLIMFVLHRKKYTSTNYHITYLLQ